MQPGVSFEENFMGVATVGERGQIVIPADARKRAGIHHGDKVLVFGHPASGGLMIIKADALRQFVSFLVEDIAKLETRAAESSEGESA
jgi:AbrB family looped-hinge helix DNA binding protein